MNFNLSCMRRYASSDAIGSGSALWQRKFAGKNRFWRRAGAAGGRLADEPDETAGVFVRAENLFERMRLGSPPVSGLGVRVLGVAMSRNRRPATCMAEVLHPAGMLRC